MRLLVPLVAIVAACGGSTDPSIVPLTSARQLVADVQFAAPGTFEVHIKRLGRNPGPNGATADDCVTMRSSFQVSANGMPGSLASLGGLQGENAEFNCVDPEVDFNLGSTPSSLISFEVADDTGPMGVTV